MKPMKLPRDKFKLFAAIMVGLNMSVVCSAHSTEWGGGGRGGVYEVQGTNEDRTSIVFSCSSGAGIPEQVGFLGVYISNLRTRLKGTIKGPRQAIVSVGRGFKSQWRMIATGSAGVVELAHNFAPTPKNVGMFHNLSKALAKSKSLQLDIPELKTRAAFQLKGANKHLSVVIPCG